MMQITNRLLALVLLAGIVAGWWLSSSSSSPLGPSGPPDRPVLRWVMKAAKNLLWLAIIAEGPPAEQVEPQLVRARVGSDGFRQLEHRGGW